MVTRRFTQGRSWLHARVGREIPAGHTRETRFRPTNSRAKVRPSAAAALQPTVYLPPLTDQKLIA
jgi:hypothetical protein